MISYDNLWKVMHEKGVTQYALIKKHKISPAQITRLKRNESVSTHTIETFCKILHCRVEDVMEYIPDEIINNTENQTASLS
ncbi:MAG: helix-turn-helix transcriptional regulator [Clostridia bacterium]|nr:helix-turn-helix transcriptional regulator [Clostridia bacterium]